MLDIKYIRENSELVEKSAREKGYKIDIKEIIACDDERKKILVDVEDLRKRRNEIAAKMKGGKPSEDLIKDGKAVKEKLAEEEEKKKKIEEEKKLEEENQKKEEEEKKKEEEDKKLMEEQNKEETYLDLLERLGLNEETKKVIIEKIEELHKEVDGKIDNRKKTLEDKIKEIDETVHGKKK